MLQLTLCQNHRRRDDAAREGPLFENAPATRVRADLAGDVDHQRSKIVWCARNETAHRAVTVPFDFPDSGMLREGLRQRMDRKWHVSKIFRQALQRGLPCRDAVTNTLGRIPRARPGVR